MKIIIMVEGATEGVFIPHLREYLKMKMEARMPKLVPRKYNGRIPKEKRLRTDVANYLSGKDAADYVIALTDVYTGGNPHDFKNAEDAKSQMKKWVNNEPRFFPHAAQYEFEAWLLPYWDSIQKLTAHNMKCPRNNPEAVNHDKPPSHWLREIFIKGSRRHYVKSRDAAAILRGKDLQIAVDVCTELKALVDTIVSLCEREC